MQRRPITSFLLSGALAAVGLSLTGCADASLDASDASPAGTGKLRFAHLAPAAASKAGSDSVSYLIGSPTYEAQRVLSRYGEPVLAVQLPAEEAQAFLDSLEADHNVEWIEPDFDLAYYQSHQYTRSYDDQVRSWSIEALGADETTFSAGDQRDARGVPDVDLFVLDSGADSPDLNVASCVQFADSTFVPCRTTMDAFGHGTAASAIAAAKDNQTGIVGIAPGTPVHSVRVMNAAGYVKESVVVAALDYVMGHKQAHPERPVVVNLSAGAYVGSSQFTALDEAVRAATAMGITVVLAAGNDGADASLYSPAHVPEAITVGAFDLLRRVPSFSNRGPLVDLYAPGSFLFLPAAGPDPRLLYLDSGTSIAAPHVAGAAVLVLSKNPSATPQQVRDALVQRARSMSNGSGRSLYVKGL